MKTALNMKSFFNLSFKQQSQCVLKSLFSGSLLQLPLSHLQRVSLLLWIHLVIRGCRAGIDKINVGYNEILSNNRVLVGVLCLTGVAPIYWAHLFFINPDLIDAGIAMPFAFINDPYQVDWFYHRNFYWLFTNREEFAIGLLLTGGFLLCKTDIKWGWKYAAVPVITVCFAEVLYQSVFISHWTHFYRPFWSAERGWELALFTLTLLFAGYKVLDYFCYRKYHTKDGNIARLFGMIRVPGIDAERKITELNKLVTESENYNAR